MTRLSDAEIEAVIAEQSPCPWEKLLAILDERDALRARVADLKSELITFMTLWAVRYAEMHALDGLHPAHFDRMKELGARMVDFRRHSAAPSPQTQESAPPG